MKSATSFFTSSIGRKWIVALTGLVLIGYVIGHLVGNLQVFGKPEKINSYAEFLHSMGGVLWAVRIFLLACIGAHIFATIQLAMENRAARPARYAKEKRVQTKLSTRTMVFSGLMVLAFIVYHLLHFTTRSTDARFRPIAEGGALHGEYDVHSMIILGFQNPLVASFYLIGVFLLSMHLSHGFSSILQTLGLNTAKTHNFFAVGGRLLAWTIFAGYASIPVAVWAGYLQLQ